MFVTFCHNKFPFIDENLLFMNSSITTMKRKYFLSIYSIDCTFHHRFLSILDCIVVHILVCSHCHKFDHPSRILQCMDRSSCRTVNNKYHLTLLTNNQIYSELSMRKIKGNRYHTFRHLNRTLLGLVVVGCICTPNLNTKSPI